LRTRIVKSFIIILIISLGAILATWAKYQSLDPCEWLHRDISQKINLPILMIKAQVKAGFLLHGIASPSAGQCIYAWWKYRFENAQDIKTLGRE